jgi:hypothetical protein
VKKRRKLTSEELSGMRSLNNIPEYKRYEYWGPPHEGVDGIMIGTPRLDQVAANEMVIMYFYDKMPFPFKAEDVANRINEEGLWHKKVIADDLLKRTGRFWCLHKVGKKIMADGSAFIKTDLNEVKRSLGIK